MQATIQNEIQKSFCLGYYLGCANQMSALYGQELPRSDHKTSLTFVKKSHPLEVSSLTEHRAAIERLLTEIDEYYALPPGWDNESEEATNSTCLDLAKEFVKLLRPEHSLPDFSAATGEEVALYWQSDQFYLIVHFFKDTSLRYFCKTSKKKITGTTLASSDTIPQELELNIPKS